MSEPRNEPCDWEKDASGLSGPRLCWRHLVRDQHGSRNQRQRTKNHIYLAKAALHAWSARTTGVQGKDTVFNVTRYDYTLTAKGCAPKL